VICIACKQTTNKCAWFRQNGRHSAAPTVRSRSSRS
jgi:L-lactate utilization protein LutB